MESDNLQQIWQEQSFAGNNKNIDKDFLLQVEAKVLSSKKRLLKILLIEVAIGLLIYVGAGMILFFNNAASVQVLFAIKIILLTALFAIPSVLLLYRSIAALRSFDLSIPLKSYLERRIASLKKSIRIYVFIGLLACCFIIIALLTDEFYLFQPLWLKISGVIYVLIFAALLSPILQYYYGKEIKILEQQLKEMGDQ